MIEAIKEDKGKEVNSYTDRYGRKINLFSENGFTEDEMEYLIDPNPFDNHFTIWEKFVPKINEPFFLSSITLSSQACAYNWEYRLFPSINRITIVEDGLTKKYLKEFIQHKEEYGEKIDEDMMEFDEFYNISKKPTLLPDEGVVCNCGCYNNKSIDKFPWEKHPEIYLIANTLEDLKFKMQVLTKKMSFYDIGGYITNCLIERNKKINEIASLRQANLH